jgi:glycosyltransferase involved in cell wall biosynthesis
LYSLRYAKQRKFPVVFISDVEPWTLLLAILLTGRPRSGPKIVGFASFIFEVKGIIPSMTWYSRSRVRINAFCNRWLSRFIQVVSDYDYMLSSWRVLPGKGHTIPEAYERIALPISRKESRTRLGLPQDIRVLLLFGVASTGKGAETLFAAMESLAPDFFVCVVGRTGAEMLPSWGGEYLLERGWNGRLRIVSRHVSEAERHDYFSACDAVILPYRKGMFGLSGNFRDAISYQRPLIVSDQYMMGKLVRERQLGLTFRLDDPADLQQRLEEFVRLPDKWFEDIAGRCNALAGECRWENAGRKYRDLFEKICREL